MSDRKPPRDIWKQPPGKQRPVEDELADSPALAEPGQPRDDDEEREPEATEEPGYSPRHRAPGRGPLIRRRRGRPDEADVEDTSERPWERDDDARTRWIDEEESIVGPPPRPVEDVPTLGPRRSERRKKAGPNEEDPHPELIRRTRDYTGRHLAPKKPGPWSRGAEGDIEEFHDRSEIDRMEPRPTRPRRTFVESDVRDEPESGLFARPWRSRRATSLQPPSEDELVFEEPEAAAGPDEDDAGFGADATTTTEEPAIDDSNVASVAGPEPDEPEPDEPEPDESEPELETPAGAEEPEADEGESEVDAPAAPAPPAAAEAAPKTPAPPAEAEPDEAGDEVTVLAEEVVAEETIGDLPLGPRTAALQERKKKKKVRQTAGGIVAIAAAIVGMIAMGVLAKRVVDPPEERVAVPLTQPAASPEDGTTLLFGTREDAGASGAAIWMTLISYDAEEEKASVVYIPPHTAVEVPGRGLQGVGEAYGSGGIPLLLVATENLLGVSVDRYLELSDKDARVFFEGLGPLTVDVPAEVRVPAGRDQARLIFVDGPQELTSELMVRLLYTVGLEGDDVELGSRHLAFWDAVFDAYDDPDEIAQAVEGAGAALGESDASLGDHAKFFAAIADLRSEELTLTALPVRPISAGDSELYATDEDELAEFVATTIGAGRDQPAEVRVQVLNGNGVPGIGQQVADRLVGEGFRVILSGNARRLNYRETLVIAYDSSNEGVALAERARELLGVGEVQVSAQQQGIVDLTIVVGKDFLRVR